MARENRDETDAPLPLEHLRRRPGRPRKHPLRDERGDSQSTKKSQVPFGPVLRADGAEVQVASGRSLVRLLDRSRAAEYLSISVDTLDRLTRHGRLPRLRLPGTECRRYDIRDLDRYIESS